MRISGRIDVNQFAQICLILEVKFRDDPFLKILEILWKLKETAQETLTFIFVFQKNFI